MPRRAEANPLSLAIGQRIRALREAKRLTLERLAFESKLGSKGHLSDIERGLTHPTAHTLEHIAERLGVQAFDLLVDPQRDDRQALVEATRQLSPNALATLLEHARRLHVSEEERRPFALAKPPQDRARSTQVPSVPLLPLDVAAGGFKPGERPEDAQWVTPRTSQKLRDGHFVARVVGNSMRPRIPDGSYALFLAPVSGRLHGRTLLMRCAGLVDEDTGASYTLKRVFEERDSAGHVRTIRLVSENPAYEAMVFDGSRHERIDPIAEFVEVLGQNTPT